MQHALVSIIIPCFNSAHFLPETLESAFFQSYTRTEIIVIDDGSTDGSADLLRSYGDRIKAEFGPNRGVSAARNRGTALSQGEFIQYLDADDLLTPTAIEQRVTVLDKSDADVAYSDWEKLVEVEPGTFKVTERIVRRIEDVHLIPEIALITQFWAPLAATTYRRSIVQKIGGWKEWLPIIQDARFLQDAALVGGRFVYVPGVGAKYRVHGTTSLSRRSESAFVLDVFHNACDLHKGFEAKGRMTLDERCALAQIYDYVARSLFFQDRAAFQECMVRLYKLQPEFQLTWPKMAELASTLFGFEIAGHLLSLLTRLRGVWKQQ